MSKKVRTRPQHKPVLASEREARHSQRPKTHDPPLSSERCMQGKQETATKKQGLTRNCRKQNARDYPEARSKRQKGTTGQPRKSKRNQGQDIECKRRHTYDGSLRSPSRPHGTGTAEHSRAYTTHTKQSAREHAEECSNSQEGTTRKPRKTQENPGKPSENKGKPQNVKDGTLTMARFARPRGRTAQHSAA